jgi:hypothetical protein
MAGSLQRFAYGLDRDDGGIPGFILLNLDESNQRAIGNEPGSIRNNLDRPNINILRIQPRYIYWQGVNSEGEVLRRKIVVVTHTNDFYQRGGNLTLTVLVNGNAEQVKGYITGSVGEKKTFVPPDNTDSGQTDGSDP